MRLAMTAVIALLACAAGCSFFVHGPPADYRPERDGPPACNRSATGTQVADTLGAVWGVVVTSVFVSIGLDEGDPAAVPVALLAAVGTAAHAGALVVSRRRTERCREAVRAYRLSSAPRSP